MPDSLPDFDALWDYSQPAETEQKFRAILEGLNFREHRAYCLELLTQYARAQGLQRQFSAARDTLLMIEEDSEFHKYPIVMIRRDYERGRVYNSAGDPKGARWFLKEAYNQALEEGEDFYAIDAAHMMAIVEAPENQHEWNLKALAIVEKSSDPRAQKWAGSLYNNIGWTYHDAGEYDKALAMFEKGRAFRESQRQGRETRIARWTVGRAMRSLGRIPEALKIQQRLEQEWEQAGEVDGYVYEELAECLFLEGAGEAAKKYFALAYAELSKDDYLVANEAARMERLKHLSEMDEEALVHEPFWNAKDAEKWREMSPVKFLSIVAHERRNLAGIATYADMLRTNEAIATVQLDEKLSAIEALDKIQMYTSMLLRVMDIMAVYTNQLSQKQSE